MKIKTLTVILCCFVALCNTVVLKGQAPYGNAGDHTGVPLGSLDTPFGYYEYLPIDFDTSSGSLYPLVLFYHGFLQGGNGTSDLSNVLVHGPPKLVEEGANFDAIIISPQSSSGAFNTADFLSLYNYLIANYPIDTNRVYVTGLSAGGGGVWDALKGHYDKIAAAAPICGTVVISNPSDFLQQTPIWAFHNFDDDVVDKNRTITNINNIANVSSSVMTVYPYGNGNSAANEDVSMQFDTDMQNWSLTTGVNQPTDKLSFTLYKNGGHDAWTKTYNNQLFWDWILAQTMGTLHIDDKAIDFKLYPNPTSDKFTISTQNEADKKIEIYTLLGNKIYDGLFSKEFTLDVSSYSSGIYFVKVIGDQNNQKVMNLILK